MPWAARKQAQPIGWAAGVRGESLGQGQEALLALEGETKS